MELEICLHKMEYGEALGLIYSCQIDDNYVCNLFKGEFYEENSKINNFVLNENIRNIKRKVENIIAHYDRYNPTVSALDDFFHKLVYDLFQKTNDNIKITIDLYDILQTGEEYVDEYHSYPIWEPDLYYQYVLTNIKKNWLLT